MKAASEAIAKIDFGILGYGIVGLFLLAWGGSREAMCPGKSGKMTLRVLNYGRRYVFTPRRPHGPLHHFSR